VVFNATFNNISVIFWQRKNPTTNQGWTRVNKIFEFIAICTVIFIN
jgi:hypothetical protein